MWDRLLAWMSGPGRQPVIWSVVSLLVVLAVYLLLRHWVYLRTRDPAKARRRSRTLAVGLTVVVVLGWIRIWLGPTGWLAQRPVGGVLEKFLWTCAAAALAYIVVRAVRHGMLRRAVAVESRFRVRAATAWVGVLVFLIACAFVWASDIQNFGVFLGIVGAGLALSLQETLVCVAGWMILVTRRPFDIGDRIEIDNRIGDVIGISVFHTSLLEVGHWVQADQSTGRMLMVPNSMLIRHAVYNYSKGFPFVWDEFSTTVTFESDWPQAKELMLEKAEIEADKMETEVQRRIEDMQHRYAIRYDQLRPIVYTRIAENGVQLTLRYLSPVRQRRTLSHRISENVLQAFQEHPKIDFAYPTTRLYRQPEERKPSLGGSSRKRRKR